MPRQRFIWPSIWTSENFMELSHRQRLLFIGIFSLADDEGKIKISSKFIKASIFPCDKISTMVIERDLVVLFQKKFIMIYETNDGDVAYIPTWKKYQKPKYPQASKLPNPTEEDEARFRESSVNIPPKLPNDSPMGWDGLGRDGLGRDTLGGNFGKIPENEISNPEFEKKQNSLSKKILKPGDKISQTGKISSSPLSGFDFTENQNSAKLTNLVNIINQHSGMGASAPFSELAKLYNEILSGVMPELRYGKFDKATSSLVSDMWQDGVTTGEEWVKFFTEISLSSYLQGKTKIKGSENCYNTGLRYCLKNYNEVMSGTKRDKPEEKEEDIMDTFTRMYGPQTETFHSDDAIDCQNYTVEEVGILEP